MDNDAEIQEWFAKHEAAYSTLLEGGGGVLMKELPLAPARIARLPKDERGYPIPFFVAVIDGKPDFRVADPKKWSRCVREKLCWICGEPLGRFVAFTIGPMCAVNRVSAEPPEHRECAEYSVKACPFLSLPAAHRREAGIPEGCGVAGEQIRRNPGVTLIWITREFTMFPADNGYLFNVGEPEAVSWWREGRHATREEVEESHTSGIPILLAAAEEDGPKAIASLAKQAAAAKLLWPEAAP